MTAMPSAVPIWRDMPNTPVPVAKRSGGSEAAAALASVEMLSPTPAPPTSQPGRNSEA